MLECIHAWRGFPRRACLDLIIFFIVWSATFHSDFYGGYVDAVGCELVADEFTTETERLKVLFSPWCLPNFRRENLVCVPLASPCSLSAQRNKQQHAKYTMVPPYSLECTVQQEKLTTLRSENLILACLIYLCSQLHCTTLQCIYLHLAYSRDNEGVNISIHRQPPRSYLGKGS